jgi:hypothetical protein
MNFVSTLSIKKDNCRATKKKESTWHKRTMMMFVDAIDEGISGFKY